MATGPKETPLRTQSNWGHSRFSTSVYCNWGRQGDLGPQVVVPNQRKPEYILKKYKHAPGRTHWILSVCSFPNEPAGGKEP